MDEQLKLKKATYHLYTFLISKMVGSLGSTVYAFGMSMYILSLTGSALSFAMNIILSIVPRTIFSPIAGILGDRLPRKWLVLGGQAGVFLTIGLLLVYTVTVDLSLAAIYTATFFSSIFGSFSSVSFSASIANLVDEERLQKAMSYNQLSYSLSGIGGPIMGGMLFGFVSMEIFLVIYLIAGFITLALESTMNFTLYKKEVTTTAEKETMFESLKAGISYVKSKTVIRSILWTSLWLNLFFTSVNIGGDFILLTLLHLDPKLIGITEAAGAIGMVITAIYFASRSNVKFPLLFSKRAVLGMSVLVILTSVPLLISLSKTSIFIYYLILMFSFGSLGVLTNTPIGVMLQKEIDEEYRARVFGIVEMMAMSMMPIGTLVYGILYDKIPAQYILVVSGVLLVTVALIFLRRSVIELAHPELKKDAIEVKPVTE